MPRGAMLAPHHPPRSESPKTLKFSLSNAPARRAYDWRRCAGYEQRVDFMESNIVCV
jgi:hypothetical protein